ncbi:methyltransferase domain-containing protein [Streptomyces sioyaensis]|uniref:methyltransferase domain-containing protein n=1 Tax=Streptomyces sioyaensis TaxID=67364 RepID=UPI0037D150A8
MNAWRKHAATLAEKVTHPQSRWHDAVASTPRHLFVPRWWWKEPTGPVLADGPSNPDLWKRVAYADTTVLTRIGTLHADHAQPDDHPEGLPTSSATLPSLTLQMYRHVRPAEGMDILDVGTGSGYGAALLAHRFGNARVTTLDVDPYLTKAAAERLDAAGLAPHVLTADAMEPLPGQWDRIVCTVSLPRIPPSLLAALRTGGRLVTNIANTCLVIGVEKTEDGGAVGRVERDWAGFMTTRHGDDYPPAQADRFEQVHDQDGEEVTTGRYPVLQVMEAWDLWTMLELTAPGIAHRYEEGPAGERTAWMVHADGSWARAEGRGTDAPTVHQGGPRRLWDELERVRHRLNCEGGLPLYGATVRIDPNGTATLTRGGWIATLH